MCTLIYAQFREVYTARHAKPYSRAAELDKNFREEMAKIKRAYVLNMYYEMQAPQLPITLCGGTGV